ncbi:MAG: 3-oxoacyl-ACP reductase FabG [Magnetococcales bacterium]|nr:3-oxoacyl-ACP reductase FabG [Magnetococcales bacterium]MBF0114067.1 3-oxoacyl-ACP reductase FabG [Magnetococcales bacterium]
MDKHILVTGASRGIGQAIAQRLARDGFNLALHYHRDQAGALTTLEAVQQIGVTGRILCFDQSNRLQCREVLEADMANHGPYWGVVLNGGIAQDNAFPAMLDEEWDAVIQTNLGGAYNVLRPIIMDMIAERRGGRIVALSSVSGMVGTRGQTNYSAAKAGIIGLVKALALEVAKRGITVNCVAPGLIDTDMTRHLPTKELQAMIPMQRIGKVAEVAAAVAFLCSEEAGYITRQVLSVNGGLI